MSKPKVINIPTYQDDRGYVYCAFDELDLSDIKRTYVVENHSRGMVRAWHGHKKADTYMHVLSGAVKLVAMKIDNNLESLDAVLTDRKPQLFYVPAGYYNGAMSLTDNTKILVYSTLSFHEVKHDDYRLSSDVRREFWSIKNR